MNDTGFEWDDGKAASNRRKHGVSFEEAATVFGDPRAVVRFDEDHSGAEDRWKVIGLSAKGRLLSVIYTRRGRNVRIISARKADGRESQTYS